MPRIDGLASTMKCRHCGEVLSLPLIDLGIVPPSNAYLTEESLLLPEKRYPLRVLVCQACWLAQTEDFANVHELFNADYAYFSGFSSSWLAHCEKFVADMIYGFGLSVESLVIEVATNDGSLLKFVKDRNIPCLGIEPTASAAAAARSKGIAIEEEFFGVQLAKKLCAQGLQADLTVANNVLAHVPDINDFVAGFAVLLKPQGVASFEFPHLLRLLAQNQFDTVYHEHFSYLSLNSVQRIFSANGLSIFDTAEFPTHGGSLRILAQRADTGQRIVNRRVADMLDVEAHAGMDTANYYAGFQAKAEKVRDDFLAFLAGAKTRRKLVVAYGAAAKGNTLLSFAGVQSDSIEYVVDKNPWKQRKFLPGSHVPIVSPTRLRESKPDYVVILPWNLKFEVMREIDYIRVWGGKFVIAVPSLSVL